LNAPPFTNLAICSDFRTVAGKLVAARPLLIATARLESVTALGPTALGPLAA